MFTYKVIKLVFALYSLNSSNEYNIVKQWYLKYLNPLSKARFKSRLEQCKRGGKTSNQSND